MHISQIRHDPATAYPPEGRVKAERQLYINSGFLRYDYEKAFSTLIINVIRPYYCERHLPNETHRIR
jgi:hypothetical protein